MTEMMPEPFQLKADLRVESYIEVDLEGPAGLAARIHIPSDDAALDALESFVAALPQGVDAALRDAEARAAAEEAGLTADGYPNTPEGSDEAARAVEGRGYSRA